MNRWDTTRNLQPVDCPPTTGTCQERSPNRWLYPSPLGQSSTCLACTRDSLSPRRCLSSPSTCLLHSSHTDRDHQQRRFLTRCLRHHSAARCTRCRIACSDHEPAPHPPPSTLPFPAPRSKCIRSQNHPLLRSRSRSRCRCHCRPGEYRFRSPCTAPCLHQTNNFHFPCRTDSSR